jgi:hypothetical protein
MSICGTPLIHRPIPAQESIFCAELAQLPLPERARRIDLKLRETRKFLGARNEKLLALRGDFDALTLDFWRRFARGLGCEDPERTIAAQKERMRSIGHISIILFTIALTGLAAARAGAIPELVVFYWCGRGCHSLCYHRRTPPSDLARTRGHHHSRTGTGTFLADRRKHRVIESFRHAAAWFAMDPGGNNFSLRQAHRTAIYRRCVHVRPDLGIFLFSDAHG